MEFSKKSYRIARDLQNQLLKRAKEFHRNAKLFDRFNDLINDGEEFDTFLDIFINTVFSDEKHEAFKKELEGLKTRENVDVSKLSEHLNETVYIDLKFIKQILYEFEKYKREKGA